MKPIALFGAGVKAYSAAVSAQGRLNCFYDIRLDQDKHATIVRGTPGSTTVLQLPTNPIRGWWVAVGLLYVVAGNTLYLISGTTTMSYTSLGTLNTSTGTVVLQDNGVQLMIVDGSRGYVYTIVAGTYYQTALNAAGSFGVITDPNFPNGATTVSFLNSRFLCEKSGTRQCYMSCQDSSGIAYDGTRWTDATTGLAYYITKENASDVLVHADVLNGAIVLWGTSTIEFWQDVGSSPQPYARINGATQTWGLAAVNSVAFLNNTAYFLGQAQQGGVQVMALQGSVPARVSTSDIENLIAGFSTWTDASSLTYIVDGHPMYQINFPTAGRSFMYDSLTQFWSELQSGVGVQGVHFANIGVTYNTKFYASDYGTGNVYQLLTTTYTDNSTPIKRQITTRHLHAEGNEFSIDELVLDMETGVGLSTGQGSNPQIMLEVSKDGGRTFGPEKWVGVGAIGDYRVRARWTRLGSARDFVFRFTMTDPIKFTILKGWATTRQGEGVAGG